MSESVKAALRPDIDQRTADYVDASVAIAQGECSHRNDEITNRLNMIDDALRKVELKVDEAIAIAKDKPDDKYALTKAKIVRLMKEMGIYDG